MEVIIGKTAGFCFGVQNAVVNTEKKLEENNKIKCLGELVHNGKVIKELEKKGLQIVDKIEDVEQNEKVIIRAHGITKEIYKKAEEKNIEIFDFTCPSVLRIHKIAYQYAQKGYFIILIGNKQHPESIGTISFCGKNSYLLESNDEIENAITKIKEVNAKKIMIIAQTTFSLEKFEKIVKEIKTTIKNDVDEIEIKNTICNATKIRQEETKELSKKMECMIIIGGKNSSNTKKLYEIAKENCENTFIIEDVKELQLEQIKRFESIGIMAGASTPYESIIEVKEILKNNFTKT